MSLQIKIRRDGWGTWSVLGLSSVPVSDLPSLSTSIDYARNACNAAPATIECMSTGCTSWLIRSAGGQRRSSEIEAVAVINS